MHRPELRKILFLGPYRQDRVIDAVHAAAPHAEILVASTSEERLQHIADAHMTIGGGITDEELAAAQELFWHHVPWVGVEGIINPAMAAKGITLTNGSGVNSANIAEHVVAMMLAFARELPRFVRDQERHWWRHWDDAPSFFELGGQTVLCMGTGAIGQEVAKRLQGFGCILVGASRSGTQVGGFERCVSFAGLDNELALADHVISSLPMTTETAGIMSRQRLEMMKPGSHFYNVGRGGTVDQDALIEVIKTGHIAGAGLDVVTPEPLPEDSELWDLPGVIITSHTSGNSPQALQRMADLTAEQIRRYLQGEELLNVVDQSAGY